MIRHVTSNEYIILCMLSCSGCNFSIIKLDQNATIEFLLASVNHHNALLNNHNFPFTISRFCKHIQNEIYIRDNFKSIAIVHFQGSRN